MKRLYLLSLLFLNCFLLSAQTTVTIKLNAGDEDATIDDYSPANNYPDGIEYNSSAWTIYGTPVIWRNLFRFDLSAIPANAIVINAQLSLYYPTINNAGYDTSLTNSNESVLQRITSAWTENAVTWNNQPSGTNQNEVVLPASVGNQDYPGIDVTAVVQDMVNDPANSFGFLLKLTSENYYARMLFASGDNPDSNEHPILMVTYTNCISQTLDVEGEDATIDDYGPANNYPNGIEYNSSAWTIYGTPVIWRNLFQFDLSSIPINATVTNADLSLYYPTTNNAGSDTSLTSSNESVLQRITSAWAEDAVTWNNQPSSTNQNEVILPASVGNQDYPGIDVTTLVQDMVSDPANSFGFLLKLTNESYYARMLFASGDNPDATEHPRLDVCWAIGESVNEMNKANDFSIYPNPCSGIFTLKWNETSGDIKSFKIIDCIGRTVISTGDKTFNSEIGRQSQVLDLSMLPKGVYAICLEEKSIQVIRKLMIQ
ncbi:MAG TPA: DNRLRE domain-containing protein [Chitinophagales bacterium]|nr:DNRLRE domain-containing protein [Chitinophagales bacterium]